MENLNAEQVKKDLQKIVDNYSGSWTRYNILSNALALINSQEQRIGEFEVELKAMRGAANSYKIHLVELTEENERLQAEITHLEGHREADIKAFKTLKADTVRKMQERLENRFDEDGNYFGIEVHSKIDQIANELMEGENATN